VAHLHFCQHTEPNKKMQKSHQTNTPTEIDFSNIEIKQGDCFINSYRVAKKYPQVEIVEGLILAIDIENGAKPMPHVWNKLGDIHFDVTKEKVWNGREVDITVRIVPVILVG